MNEILLTLYHFFTTVTDAIMMLIRKEKTNEKT